MKQRKVQPRVPKRKVLTGADKARMAMKRDAFAYLLAPVFATEFFRSDGMRGSGAPWTDYDDLADSVWNMADAMARRFK